MAASVRFPLPVPAAQDAFARWAPQAAPQVARAPWPQGPALLQPGPAKPSHYQGSAAGACQEPIARQVSQTLLRHRSAAELPYRCAGAPACGPLPAARGAPFAAGGAVAGHASVVTAPLRSAPPAEASAGGQQWLAPCAARVCPQQLLGQDVRVPVETVLGKAGLVGDVASAGCSVSTAAPGCSISTAALECSGSTDEHSEQLSAHEGERRGARDAAKFCYPACELRVGACTTAGVKLDYPGWQNQDTYLVVPLGEMRMLVAVFDGHGQWGHLVAAHARASFSRNVQGLVPNAPAPLSDEMAGAALSKLFASAKEALARETDGFGRALAQFSGTTATAAIVDGVAGRMAIAHVGDSALVLAAGSRVERRTADHVVDAEAERWIRSRGGEVQTFTVSGITARRVCMRGSRLPGLAMARALGDLVAHDLGVIDEPEISVGIPFVPGANLILASDGVWDKTSADSAAQCVAGFDEPSVAAQALVEISRTRWPQGGNIDDITAVVVTAPRTSFGPRA